MPDGNEEARDVRFGVKDYGYGPKIMGPEGARLIAIQKGVPLAVDWLSDTN